MNLSAPISYKYNHLSLDEKIFVYDIAGDEILFPVLLRSENVHAWLNHIISSYPEHWRCIIDLNQDKTYTFRVAKDAAHLPSKSYNVHVSRINDKVGRNIVLFKIDEHINVDDDDSLKERNEFFDLALHDLQSPVRKLSTLLERMILKEHSMFSTEAKPYLERIKMVAAELSSLTKGLASLYEAGIETEAFENCDLNILAHLAVQEIKQQPEADNAAFIINNLPVVMGDFDQLKIVFISLFHNAIKFNETGKKCVIEVTADIINDTSLINAGDSKNIYHRITVKDNGIGFNKDNAVKIFEPFIRLNGKSAYPGSGLGLAVCAKIIEHHQGKIYADAPPSGGCTVSIVLPGKISL